MVELNGDGGGLISVQMFQCGHARLPDPAPLSMGRTPVNDKRTATTTVRVPRPIRQFTYGGSSCSAGIHYHARIDELRGAYHQDHHSADLEGFTAATDVKFTNSVSKRKGKCNCASRPLSVLNNMYNMHLNANY